MNLVQSVEDAVRIVEKDPNFKLLRRFVPQDSYGDPGPIPEKNGIYLDCEATGTDTKKDGILELAMQPFKYTEDGRITSLGKPYMSLNDPGIEISDKIRGITGIKPEDIVGHRIDEQEVEEIVRAADLVIAHNANYDRRMSERHFEFNDMFRRLPWGCSQHDVPWRVQFGALSERLEVLAMTQCGLFYSAHRALIDCQVGIHVLATSQDEGCRTAFSYLLEAVQSESLRIWAIGSPFHTKDLLKDRGYRWNDGSDGRPKAWHTKVSPDLLEEENEWLRKHVSAYPEVTETTAVDRYSTRER